MDIKEAVELTKSKVCLRISITGICKRISQHRGSIDNGQKLMLAQFANNFKFGREAFLNKDFEALSEFFSFYV